MHPAIDETCQRVINAEPCAASKAQHVDGRCPRDPSRRFKLYPTLTTRASASFSAGEVAVLHKLGLQALGSNAPIARSDGFASLMRKVLSMRAKLAEQAKP